MKILIAVPCMDQVPVPFCYSLASLEKPKDAVCTLTMKTGALIYTSRDAMAMQAIQNEYDYVFWMDADMQFPTDTLVKLLSTLRNNKLDIVSGLYFRRVPPYSPVLFDQLEIDGVEATYTEFDHIPDDLFEVGGCGFGCVLMDVGVFLDVQGRFEQIFSPIGRNGEDVAFCWRARQCGYQIWCDPSVKCGHVGYSVIDDRFFRAFSKKEADNADSKK